MLLPLLMDNLMGTPAAPAPPAPTPPASGNTTTGGRVILMPKRQGEKVIRSVDFISRLGPTETILSAITTASVYSGTDPSPSSIVSGSATFAGTKVNQYLQAGVLGVMYELLFTITTSLGQTLEMAAFWTVEPDLP